MEESSASAKLTLNALIAQFPVVVMPAMAVLSCPAETKINATCIAPFRASHPPLGEVCDFVEFK